MNDEDAFLAAIKSAPNDDLPRLVYADWLDEQGRPGGEFLRVDCDIARLDPAEFEQWELVEDGSREDGMIDSAPSNPLDAYYWERVHLVAKLRGTTRGLDDDWMAAVSRVPIDEINARIREIQRALQRRVTVAEMLEEMAKWDRPPEPNRSLWAKVSRLFKRRQVVPVSPEEGPHVIPMREWAEANLLPGDELWEFDSGRETWENMCGEMGYAVVRNGKVVEFEVLMMN